MPRKPMPDVIVVLPGILGSVLQKNGKDIWALSAGALARGVFTGLGSIDDLTLKQDSPEVEDLGDGVTASRLMSDVHLIPGLWKIDGYSKITSYIRSTFKVEAGKNYFEFPYDWRRDNAVAAKRLRKMALPWLENWQAASGMKMAKLILVCHSMGGLVARYFLENLGGWEHTRSLVSFGTPYRGSLNALDFIANGLQKKLGPVTLLDLSDFLRSLTSVYQLLPVYDCFDQGDGILRKVGEIQGVPNLDAKKAASALKFHNEIRAQVDAHVNDPKYQENGYITYPIVGTHQPTLQTARLEGKSVKMVADYQGKDLGGDGTVPRVSATPIELSQARRETFAAQRHGSLQNTDSVLVQLEGILEGNQINLDIFKAWPAMKEPVHLGLELDDTYSSTEPIRIRVCPDKETRSLSCILANAETNQPVAAAQLQGVDDSMETVLPPQPCGVYRLTVSGDQWVTPVTDVLVVQ